MLDRNIPFYSMILRCDIHHDFSVELPQGFAFKYYQKGDESAWAELEFENGDFDSVEEAEIYFKENYCIEEEELHKRCVFVITAQGKIVGSCIAWRDKRGQDTVASLHWLIVSEAYQNKRIGKALCCKIMSIFKEFGEVPVYIHTQPWSYKAILLYIDLGFYLQKTDSFADYENQYTAAIDTLKDILSLQQYNRIVYSSKY